MNIWRNPRYDASTLEPRTIEADGIILGSAVRHQLGVRFIAADDRVRDMDQSIWPSLDYAYRSARQLFKSSRAADPFRAGWGHGKADGAPQIRRSALE